MNRPTDPTTFALAAEYVYAEDFDLQERAVLLALAWFSDAVGLVDGQSVETIAEKAGTSPSTAKRVVRALVLRDYVAKEAGHVRMGFKHATSVYRLLFLPGTTGQPDPSSSTTGHSDPHMGRSLEGSKTSKNNDSSTPTVGQPDLLWTSSPEEHPLPDSNVNPATDPIGIRAAQLQRWYATELIDRDLSAEKWRFRNTTRPDWTGAFREIVFRAQGDGQDEHVETAIAQILDAADETVQRDLCGPHGPMTLVGLVEPIALRLAAASPQPPGAVVRTPTPPATPVRHAGARGEDSSFDAAAIFTRPAPAKRLLADVIRG